MTSSHPISADIKKKSIPESDQLHSEVPTRSFQLKSRQIHLQCGSSPQLQSESPTQLPSAPSTAAFDSVAAAAAGAAVSAGITAASSADPAGTYTPQLPSSGIQLDSTGPLASSWNEAESSSNSD